MNKTLLLLFFSCALSAQNFTFNSNTTGQRVCLVEAEVNTAAPSVTIKLLDASGNTSHPTNIYRRQLYGNGTDWTLIASNIPAGTTQWTDTDVSGGDVWEYQVKRANTWFYAGEPHDATGYAVGSLLADKTNYQGRMILLVADNIAAGLSAKYDRLKKELTGDGWQVSELIVPKATSWDSGNAVVAIRSQIQSVYNSAPADDKPKMLFILGHVPMPRSGATTITAPDAHDQNKGARGCDGYYADIDGIFTDIATFNPGGLQTPFAINLPGDFKWDQDFLPSQLEMAFGRVDFEDIDDVPGTEIQKTETYLDKLSNYKNVTDGWEMGNKTGFAIGYDNSNDGSYRSLPGISKSANVFQNYAASGHPAWVLQNGPFKVYMQNSAVPDISEWNTYGMDATVFTSDQSYWGWNDVPQAGYIYSRSRSLLATPTKCLVTLWTTTGVDLFYQACSGDALGFAVKAIMDHSSSNQNIEKAPQNWDTADWWNRSHFSYNGDPTIRLYQVKPVQNLTLSGSDPILSWAGPNDATVIGYHIYESDTEFGKYVRLTPTPVAQTSYAIENYQPGHWYMVRSVKIEESGCGTFLNAGEGVFIYGSLLSTAQNELKTVKLFPNPANESVTISSPVTLGNVSVYTMQGQLVLEKNTDATELLIETSRFSKGLYVVAIASGSGNAMRKLIVE